MNEYELSLTLHVTLHAVYMHKCTGCMMLSVHIVDVCLPMWRDPDLQEAASICRVRIHLTMMNSSTCMQQHM
jgi:hypothetical protein